jgi:hypothetical protein
MLISLLALAISSARNSAFQWPDSSRYWRALVNVNQYAASYIKNHPQWFSQDRLVTDFAVHGVRDQALGGEQYSTVRKLLESKKMYVGTYISGTTVLPASEQTGYPHEAVSTEELPSTARYKGSWSGHASRRYIDVSDADTRHALEAGIRKLWESSPAPVRFVDNMPPHPKVDATQSWELSCKYISELRGVGESLGSRVIFNIPMHVASLSDQETRQLIEAVGQNGIALEMPWHANVRRSPQATVQAAKRYRQLLDSGMAIVMIPVNTPEDELTNWVRSWRKTTDYLYLGGAFWKQPDMSIYRLE